jgi:uncharacterized protein (TIGR02147 family)
MNEQVAVQKLLQRKLAQVQEDNPRYSLRAFAGRVKLNPGVLSGILNGKRFVSRKLAERLASNLLLDPQERSELLSRFPEKRSYKKAGAMATESVDPKYLELSAAHFRVMGQWEHFAILSLLNTKNFKSNLDWISRRLGVPKKTVEASIQRLVDLGMIERDAKGHLTRSTPSFRSTDDVADISVRKSHDQSLELARASLHRDSVRARDHTSITMAIDPAKIGQAKEAIRRFQDEISALLESGDQTEVYRMSVQLFPLTRIEEGEFP